MLLKGGVVKAATKLLMLDGEEKIEKEV